MIQRIQSVFLLLTAILMGVIVFFPISDVQVNGEAPMAFNAFGIGDNYPTWGVVTFAALSAILAFVNIFLYKKRKLQARLALLTALFIIIYHVAVVVYFLSFMNRIEGVTPDASISLDIQAVVILPLIALICDIIAYFRIRKDEKLVKSLDRIR